ncbi:hypothetical protein PHYBLDRAFT_60895 [Phycomyces blakesleeanus NRRL 1555(-)]|uniref:Uncharacterized protein n=1 Tax=Phycomyces blakesleeanus (strain ATCC 8743b / DSM 1359 / FGSC 10004 / NBRC 33097 / NRRL 1555) TaxID=763407 RepID=A0A162Y125_PHYB8|nr:hypothetical protein PHYBLDRAFT_60895 [Phycomyces blakesleeanus NRRL 1555(-)]OAD77775.1 hypothetical protein PHYBLDRAFT_60895 [Phycomyces blakesleeanus NRRL 1555(-)]|eukprot:XP_018295815.1 hypothetical protein PHYBLDRAFT_60895 [Phycomyces blakesleeanus NRRL 1555(-)]
MAIDLYFILNNFFTCDIWSEKDIQMKLVSLISCTDQGIFNCTRENKSKDVLLRALDFAIQNCWLLTQREDRELKRGLIGHGVHFKACLPVSRRVLCELSRKYVFLVIEDQEFNLLFDISKPNLIQVNGYPIRALMTQS